MTVGRVEVLGSRVRLSGPLEASLPFDEATRGRFSEWAGRYRAVVEERRGAAPLLVLGREMLVWLDTGGWASTWLSEPGPRQLEVASSTAGLVEEGLLLSLPWEVLAVEAGFLAGDALQPFQVWRRIGQQGEPKLPQHRDLSLLFMAASPRGGGSRLQYEAEEAGILAATERLPLGLTVEETGCGDFLQERIALEGSFEALHLSCHGGLDGGTPVVQLESPEGDPHLVPPAELVSVWGETPPHLVFLSACRTAQYPAGGATDSYARALTRAAPSVVGWDGSVMDSDAIGFATVFYQHLAGYATPGFAAGEARGELLRQHLADPQVGRDWHLARLWLGTHGGGPLCARGKPRRRLLPRDVGTRAFLDAKRNLVPVAGAATFVGRRREAQEVLRAFRDDSHAGVLIHGMGNLGKSSLAARVAGRLPRLDPVVVFGGYDPALVFEQVCAALPPGDRKPTLERWLPRIAHDPTQVTEAVEELLTGPFYEHPVLVMVDDLEQILEPLAPGRELTRVRTDYGWATAIASLLAAFDKGRGDSRLLVTSRYDFTVTDTAGSDLAAGLVRVPLTPFDPSQRELQWRASREHQRRSSTHPADTTTTVLALRRRALQAAGGNPGLQDILTTPLQGGDLAAAEAAITAIEGFLDSGEVPAGDQNATTGFFRRMPFQTYTNALTHLEKQLLAALAGIGAGDHLTRAGLGIVPIPATAVEGIGAALGVPDPARAVRRLVGLGLLDHYQPGVVGPGHEGLAVNPLAQPLLPVLDDHPLQQVATTTLDTLRALWASPDNVWPRDPRAILATRTAVVAARPADAQEGALVALNLLYDTIGTRDAADLALALGTDAVECATADTRTPLDLVLVRRLAEIAGRRGRSALHRKLIHLGLTAPTPNEKALAQLQVGEAEWLATAGQPDAAQELLNAALGTFQQLGDIRSEAVTRGQIADILQARGQLDEALRIRQDEQLPVYQQLGDIYSEAVTRGKIADILQARGQLDEALRIRQDEELPVYQQLGDIRSEAVTQLKLVSGRIGQGSGSLQSMDEGLARCLEQFRALGDSQGAAISGSLLAQIRAAQGLLPDALDLLEQAQSAFQAVSDAKGVQHCQALRQSFAQLPESGTLSTPVES